MEIIIAVGVFFLTLFLVLAGYFIVRKIHQPEQRTINTRLNILSRSADENEAIDIAKKRTLSQLPWLNTILLKFSSVIRIERLLTQADTRHQPGFFLILSALLFFSVLLLAVMLRWNIAVMIVPSLVLATTPFVYLLHKKKKRIEKFEKRLPDALDLISRSLKAGHAFTAGLRMVADEFGDPVGTEFGRALDEINFGVGVPEALTHMTERADCDDLKFFAISVIIQRETGGNLAEILESLSRLIRERFKFQGRVKVLSAEGKISAITLVAIPFLIAGFLSFFRPEYVKILISDPVGKILVSGSLIMMGIGSYIMKKMVSIRI